MRELHEILKNNFVIKKFVAEIQSDLGVLKKVVKLKVEFLLKNKFCNKFISKLENYKLSPFLTRPHQ